MAGDDRPFDVQAALAEGLERMAAALGPEAAQSARRDIERARAHGDGDAVELPIALTWGWLMGRPGLSPRDRVLAMISVDIARGTSRALADHLRLAGSADVTAAELRELFVHLGPYAGYPALNDAWAVLARHLADQRAAADQQAAGQREPAGQRAVQGAGWLGTPAHLGQLTVVVRDAARAAEALALLLGIGRWQVTRVDDDRAELVTGGRPQHYQLLRAVGRLANGLRIELIEPRGGAIPAHLALLSRGPGIVSLLAAELAEADAQRIEATADVQVSTWRAAGTSLLSLDTRTTLGYRTDVACPSLEAFDAALGTDETWQLGGADGLVPPGPLGHLGIVVPDVEAATRAHAAAYGRQRWPLLSFSTDDGTLTEARYHGGPGTEAYLSTVARVGGFAVELIQPTAGPSRYLDGFLRPRGPGIHHVFFEPLADPGRWDEVVGALLDHGYPLVTEALGWDGALQYAYVDCLAAVGFDVELVRMLREIELRPRDRAVLTFDHQGRRG